MATSTTVTWPKKANLLLVIRIRSKSSYQRVEVHNAETGKSWVRAEGKGNNKEIYREKHYATLFPTKLVVTVKHRKKKTDAWQEAKVKKIKGGGDAWTKWTVLGEIGGKVDWNDTYVHFNVPAI